METKWIQYEHVNFNATHWKGKPEKDFIKGESHHGLSEAQLKEAFALINKPEDKAAPEEGK